MVTKGLIAIAIAFLIAGCSTSKTFQSDHCDGISFRYPSTWRVSVLASENLECSLTVSPVEWEKIRNKTAYELNSPYAIEINSGRGNLANAIERWGCLEERDGELREVCGRGPSPVHQFASSSLSGIRFESTYGAFYRGGEGGYQGLTSSSNYLLSDGRHWVGITVGWCGNDCERIRSLVHTLTFRPDGLRSIRVQQSR